MTFKDLRKRLSNNQEQEHHKQSNNLALLSSRLWNKPFWIWDIAEHKREDITTRGDCCFNHIVGLPQKDGVEKPIFDYEKLLYDSSLIPEFNNPLNHDFKHKHLWVKKGTGLGVTEFFLRLMAWLCLRNDDYYHGDYYYHLKCIGVHVDRLF